MDLAPVIARIGALEAIRFAGAAADFSAAAAGQHQTPAAYVVPLRERASANRLANAVSQRCESAFGVVLAISNLRDTRGENAIAGIEAVRLAVRGSLLGWMPGADFAPITYLSGRLLQMTPGVLWWTDEYTTDFYLRAV